MVATFLCASMLLLRAETPSEQSDTDSPNSIISAVYDVISGPAGQKRDWNRMQGLFSKDARMMAIARSTNGDSKLHVMTVDDYIKQSGPTLESRGFFEKEVSKKTEHFGNIVHVWSTYEARMKKEDPKPFMRGINSFQLWNDGKRWWVTSILWQPEDAANPLPTKYTACAPTTRASISNTSDPQKTL